MTQVNASKISSDIRQQLSRYSANSVALTAKLLNSPWKHSRLAASAAALEGFQAVIKSPASAANRNTTLTTGDGCICEQYGPALPWILVFLRAVLADDLIRRWNS